MDDTREKQEKEYEESIMKRKALDAEMRPKFLAFLHAHNISHWRTYNGARVKNHPKANVREAEWLEVAWTVTDEQPLAPNIFNRVVLRFDAPGINDDSGFEYGVYTVVHKSDGIEDFTLLRREGKDRAYYIKELDKYLTLNEFLDTELYAQLIKNAKDLWTRNCNGTLTDFDFFTETESDPTRTVKNQFTNYLLATGSNLKQAIKANALESDRWFSLPIPDGLRDDFKTMMESCGSFKIEQFRPPSSAPGSDNVCMFLLRLVEQPK